MAALFDISRRVTGGEEEELQLKAQRMVDEDDAAFSPIHAPRTPPIAPATAFALPSMSVGHVTRPPFSYTQPLARLDARRFSATSFCLF